MSIAADWQAELRGVLVGASTSYILTGPISGLGVAQPRTADSERGNEAGDVAGLDVASRRILTVQLGIDGSDAANGWGLFETLKAAWRPSTVDLAFDLRLPGFSSVARRFYGRPRGLEDQLDLLRLGWIDCLATFEALDPYAYGAAVTVSLPGGATTLTAGGTTSTDRYTVAVTAGSGTVVVAVAGAGLTLTGVAGTVSIDGRARTIVDGSGVSLYSHLVAGSTWPTLAPGANTVTLTGATGSVAYRPAYL